VRRYHRGVEIFAAYLHFFSIMVFAGLLATECGLCDEHLQPAHVPLLAAWLARSTPPSAIRP